MSLQSTTNNVSMLSFITDNFDMYELDTIYLLYHVVCLL